MSTSPSVRMLQAGGYHLSVQGSSIGYKDSQLCSERQSISLRVIQQTCTDGIFVNIVSLVDNQAHFRHSLDSNDTLDCEVGLIVGHQSIRREPVYMDVQHTRNENHRQR